MSIKYKYSIENFRAIAIIFVMLSHITSYSALGSFQSFVKFLVVDATTFFVFISGYLFAHTESCKNFNYLRYLLRKVQFVISPYLLLLVIPIAMGVFFKQYVFLQLNITEFIFWSLIMGGVQVGPMWFIPLIALFFLLSFVFIRLKPGLFLGFITIIALLISIYTQRPFGNLNPFLSFIHFLGFYLLGISLFYSQNFFEKFSIRFSILLIINCFIIFLGSFYFSMNVEEEQFIFQGFFYRVGLLNFMQLGKLALLMGIFLFLEKFYNRKNNYLSYLAKISFGLFFIHGYYMVLVSRFVSSNIKDDALMLLVELTIVIIFSIITVYVIRKLIPIKSRYVIGC